jgi:ubiquinone/menaquinone biosynthesis C-methylase UbiE
LNIADHKESLTKISMKTFFEAFGQVAIAIEDTLIISGRRFFHKNLIKKIAKEIRQKLELRKGDAVLEIGCGPGDLLYHLQKYVGSIVGIDHPNVIRHAMAKLGQTPNVEFLPGNWFDIPIEKTFDKILIYSVIHYLETYEDLIRFLDKAIKLLNQGGRILVGDVPNNSKMERFRKSTAFEIIEKQYRNKLANNTESGKIIIDNFRNVNQRTILIDDDLILTLMAKYRKQGLDVYLVPQAYSLPFGYSREDILICKGYPIW